MATIKPTKPNSTLPTTFGGTKTAYTAAKITSGYEDRIEEIIDGGNLNYCLAGIFERLEYLTAIADVLNNMPIGKQLVIDSNNKYDYTENSDVDLSNLSSSGQAIIDGKMSTDASNATTAGKKEVVSWGRNYTKVGTTVVSGSNFNIQGTYSLGFNDNKVKIGLFKLSMTLTSQGATSVSFQTDVTNDLVEIMGTNNLFITAELITVPFINSVSIGFPRYSGGISNFSLYFLGYM